MQTTRNGAVALARTVINGVSNNARIETIRENADAIDGARFVGTLDGKTCPHCGALDGAVWGPDELDKIRRPPLRVSCRCCVVPHVVLKGPDGKVFEIGSRPAANADFDALAKEAYNEAARKKSSPRRWDDLSPSTRLKYYYKAQKDFEKRTGKPAYRQVSPSTTFAEYFERQDDAFKRSWLGAKRYEAYRNGAKFGDVAKPSATYRATLPELPQTPGNGPISPSNASETPSTANDPPQAETSPQEPKIDRSTLPDFDGSPKQNAWAADLREKELDEWEAVALSERVKKAVDPAKSKRRFFYNAEVERQKDLVRAEIEKRGEAVVLAEMEAAAREIAAEIFANPSARDWIDGRDGPSVWARAINKARRRIATTGSAAKPKPAFDLPPLDLPELKTPRLSGSPRQIE
ncbi:MAG: minor capsid protein [Thermoguttaceae bacterium]|nr:minor capsid protein [Thermoguttaceae bacterium]